MSTYDWSRFKRSVFINAPADKVFEAWITPSQIATWFLLRADFTDSHGNRRDPDSNIEEGDTYEWQWWNYDGVENGTILKLDKEKRHLELSFASDQCTVIVDVEKGEVTPYFDWNRRTFPQMKRTNVTYIWDAVRDGVSGW